MKQHHQELLERSVGTMLATVGIYNNSIQNGGVCVIGKTLNITENNHG